MMLPSQLDFRANHAPRHCPMTGFLLAAGLLLLLSAAVLAGQSRAWLALTVSASALLLACALPVALGGGPFEWRNGIAPCGEPMHLRVDGLSALFLALLAVVGGAGAAYGHGYELGGGIPGGAVRARFWWAVLLAAMAGVLTISNGLHFLVAWEVFAVAGYFLIVLDSADKAARKAGWLYLAASHAGTLVLFGFFALLAARTGSWDLGPLRERSDLAPLCWLVLAGFGIKAGLFPVHMWLPSAHAAAPSPVSAILSGVALKIGVYGIMRFSGWLPAPAALGWVLAGLGAAGALAGAAFALAQTDLKRLLAYCSVENIGVIFTGLGLALIAQSQGASWGGLALAGSMWHVWNHGLFKSLLFFAGGAVQHATGTRRMTRLGGLWRSMPWTAVSFAVGSAAVAALPPLNGLVSEWMIYLGMFSAVHDGSTAVWMAVPAAVLMAMAGALALATFIKAGAVVFLGEARTQPAQRAHEGNGWMRGPMALTALMCIGMGLFPGLCWPPIRAAVATWNPAWAAAASPAPLQALGQFHLGLALAAALAMVLLGWRVRRNGLRRGPTWDCGYAQPTARMQYSAGSFGETAAGWFTFLLRPERQQRRPRGLFPKSAFLLEHVPDTVLERMLQPVAAWVMRGSLWVRRLQHGRLQSYILYLLAGLAALGIFVAIGGVR